MDIDCSVDVAEDDIRATADYRCITEVVVAMIEQRSFDLIEAMAMAIAEEIAASSHIVRATVVVHKPNAARRLGIDGVAAAATAGRDPGD